MSASRIVLASLPSFCKKLSKLVKFDKVLTKPNLHSFLRHGVSQGRHFRVQRWEWVLGVWQQSTQGHQWQTNSVATLHIMMPWKWMRCMALCVHHSNSMNTVSTVTITISSTSSSYDFIICCVSSAKINTTQCCVGAHNVQIGLGKLAPS